MEEKKGIPKVLIIIFIILGIMISLIFVIPIIQCKIRKEANNKILNAYRLLDQEGVVDDESRAEIESLMQQLNMKP